MGAPLQTAMPLGHDTIRMAWTPTKRGACPSRMSLPPSLHSTYSPRFVPMILPSPLSWSVPKASAPCRHATASCAELLEVLL